MTHTYTMNIYNFIYLLLSFCYSLIKEEDQRPKYNKLLEHPFIRGGEKASPDVAAYVATVLDSMSLYQPLEPMLS